MFTLIAMGVGVAYLYSLVAHFAPSLFPPAFRDAMGTVPVYFEAAAVITVLVLLGQVLELRARERTSGAIKALLDLAPKTARRVTADGQDEEVTLDLVVMGDHLRVRPGEKVPVDGVIAEGRVSIDESLVTGESMPVTKEAGAKVIAGSLNKTGSFVMVAEKVGSETLLSRIVQMVAEAQRSRAPIQRMTQTKPPPGNPGRCTDQHAPPSPAAPRLALSNQTHLAPYRPDLADCGYQKMAEFRRYAKCDVAR
jgi:cation transport ATPase